MNRTLRNLLLVIGGVTALVLGVFVYRSPDPGYAVQEWLDHSHFSEYDDMIIGAGRRYRVDPMLLKAIVWRESKFSPRMVGTSGERGLMQIMEPTAKDWARIEKIETFEPTDLFDPKTNLDAGAWYVARSLERWKSKDDPIPFVLAEYNAGRKRVDRWIAETGHGQNATAEDLLKQMDFPSTRQYIDDVVGRYRFYKQRGRL
jgi:soluble lytic murein transglycosylase